MCIGKAAAILGQLIKHRSLHHRCAVTSKVPISNIVGEDENNVGFFGGRQRRSERDQRREEEARDSHLVDRDNKILETLRLPPTLRLGGESELRASYRFCSTCADEHPYVGSEQVRAVRGKRQLGV